MTQKRLSWATLTGPDARDFLHRITTVNVRDLEPGRGAKGCILNAQGKLQALFTLWQYGPEDFGFEYDPGRDDYWKKNFFATIDQYTFAEKMTLLDVTTLESRWLFAEPSREGELLASLDVPGLRAGETLATQDGLRICHHGSVDFGRPWITVWAKAEAMRDFGFIVDDEATLERWRIEAVRPRTDLEITEGASPLELGLVDAIASNKGCYPGQEVIEKIVSLGSPAKRLVRIEGSGNPPPLGPALMEGSAPFNKARTDESAPPNEAGQLTSVARTENGFVGLVVVRKIHAKEGLELQLPGATAKITAVAAYA
jgi:folate-binding protein YgfZ